MRQPDGLTRRPSPAEMSAQEACYVVLDTETSGLSVQHERIISIAASCRGQEFSRLVNPGKRIPRGATAVNGITDDMVAPQPTWEGVGPEFWAWVAAQAEGAPVVLVAFNAPFDCKFVAAANARLDEEPALPARLEVVDPLRVCRGVLPKLPSYRQAAVFAHLFGAEPAGQHDALGDVRALVSICEHPAVAPHLGRFRAALDLRALGQKALTGVPAPRRPAAPAPRVPLALLLQRVAPPTTPPPPRAVTGAIACTACGRVYSAFFDHKCVTAGGGGTDAAEECSK